jgi:hypothetical protein
VLTPPVLSHDDIPWVYQHLVGNSRTAPRQTMLTMLNDGPRSSSNSDRLVCKENATAPPAIQVRLSFSGYEKVWYGLLTLNSDSYCHERREAGRQDARLGRSSSFGRDDEWPDADKGYRREYGDREF